MKEESEHLFVRAELVVWMQDAISFKQLKRAETAKLLRVTESRVTHLVRGQVDRFSTDELIDMLARLGVGVRLGVRRAGPRVKDHRR